MPEQTKGLLPTDEEIQKEGENYKQFSMGGHPVTDMEVFHRNQGAKWMRTEAQRVIGIKDHHIDFLKTDRKLIIKERDGLTGLLEKDIKRFEEQQALIEKLAEALKFINEKLNKQGYNSEKADQALQLHQDYKSKQK